MANAVFVTENLAGQVHRDESGWGRDVAQIGLIVGPCCADIGEGGLAVALAECCFGGIGAMIDVESGLRPEFALFHEAPSRVLISTAEPEAVQRIATQNKIECLRIGVTIRERLRIDGNSVTRVDCPVDRLREIWEQGLEQLLMPAHAEA